MKFLKTAFCILFFFSIVNVSAQVTLVKKRKTIQLPNAQIYAIEFDSVILTYFSNEDSDLIKKNNGRKSIIPVYNIDGISLVGQSVVVKTSDGISKYSDTTYMFPISEMKGIQTMKTSSNVPIDGIGALIVVAGGTALIVSGIDKIVNSNNSGYVYAAIGSALLGGLFLMYQQNQRNHQDIRYYPINPSQWTIKH